jgi:hypothetical protein
MIWIRTAMSACKALDSFVAPLGEIAARIGQSLSA